MTQQESQKQTLPPQHQNKQPGIEKEMRPRPKFRDKDYKGSGKLEGKVALITGGDSGIGRAVAVYYAIEGADVAIVYLNEHQDAEETRRNVEQHGRRCILISGDIGSENFCQEAVEETVSELGRLDILVNNAAVQYPQKNIEDISSEQLEKTFRTNIFSMFYMTKAAVKHLKQGSAVINTASITAYEGSPQLMDYASTKGAIVAFTRSVAQTLIEKGIRMNAVAPGPVWTPLIPASFSKEKVATFGADTLLGRPAEPEELAPSYVFLASEDSSFVIGEIIHVNGGRFVSG
jgi:NAD(P)-dependent dehydrogenase (short-subunit alcohol dehydrogenase family)